MIHHIKTEIDMAVLLLKGFFENTEQLKRCNTGAVRRGSRKILNSKKSNFIMTAPYDVIRMKILNNSQGFCL